MSVKRPFFRSFGLPNEVVVTLLYLLILFIGHLIHREYFHFSQDMSERIPFWEFGAQEWFFFISPAFLYLILHNTYQKSRRVQNYLVDQEKWFRTLFEHGNDAILVINESFIVVDCNGRACRLFNVSDKDELLGKTPLDLSPMLQSDGQPSGKKAAEVTAALFKGEPQQFEWQHMQKNGELIETEISLNLVIIEGEKYMQAIIRDIRVRKNNEEKIKWFNRLLEQSLNEIFVFDAATLRFIEVNRGAQLNIGYSMDELREMTPVDIKPEMTAESFEEIISPLRDGTLGTTRFQTVHRRKDGSTYPVEVHLEFVANHPAVFVAMILDISIQKKAEKELQRLSMAIHQAAESVVITDARGIIEYVNPAVEAVTGYSLKQIIGKNPRILKSGLHDAAFYKEMWSQISSGRSWKGVFTNRRKNGDLYDEECTISPVHDESGTIINYVSVKRDITREIRLKEQVRQSQKMEAIGRLAGGIAHDFNNILQTIMGSCEMLMVQAGNETEIPQDVIEIQKAAKFAADLTRQLLTFSRKEKVQFMHTDLNKVVENQKNMLERLLGENMSLIFEPATGLKPVLVDSGQLEQIVMNLVVNARDAMPQGGTILIRTENTKKRSTGKMPEPLAKEHVCLTVSDSGTGMSPHVANRLFEPFFTTKSVSKQGAGLGLSIVYGIVQQLKGWIDVDSEPGRGTVFRIYLPASDSSDAIFDADRDEGSEALDSRRNRILLVEDDPDLKCFTVQVLQGAGYEVFAVETAEHAMGLLRQQNIDLLISDVFLPDQNGIKLEEYIANEKNDIRVIITSGHEDQYIDMQTILHKNIIFIKKPFNIIDLINLVDKILSGHEADITQQHDNAT